MGKKIIISGVDFSANAITIAKAVEDTPSMQYVYVANITAPPSDFDWNTHKISIQVQEDGSITTFNLPEDSIAIPLFVRGGEESNTWLKEIDLTYLSGLPLESFARMLVNSTSLKDVIIGGMFPSLMGSDSTIYMFYGCSSLENVVIDESFNAPNLSDITSMFYSSHLRKITGLKNLIKPTITKVASLFADCEMLEEIDLTGCNMTGVTNCSRMFSSCSSLVRLIGLNELDVSHVTNFERMFSAVSNYTVPFDISNWSISENANTKAMFLSMLTPELNANCFTALYGDISQMFYMGRWNTIHLDNLNDVSAVTTSDDLFSNYTTGTPKVTIANVTNEAVKTMLKTALNAVSAGGSSDWQEATVDGVLCLVP